MDCQDSNQAAQAPEWRQPLQTGPAPEFRPASWTGDAARRSWGVGPRRFSYDI